MNFARLSGRCRHFPLKAAEAESANAAAKLARETEVVAKIINQFTEMAAPLLQAKESSYKDEKDR